MHTSIFNFKDYCEVVSNNLMPQASCCIIPSSKMHFHSPDFFVGTRLYNMVLLLSSYLLRTLLSLK